MAMPLERRSTTLRARTVDVHSIIENDGIGT